MKIIRVEHDDGNGMFRSATGKPIRNIYGLEDMWNRHSVFGNPGMPLPGNDGIDIRLDGHGWYLAFASMDDFNGWVKPEEAKILIHNGYKILLIDAVEIQIGKHQVAYTKTSVSSTEDISSLFK